MKRPDSKERGETKFFRKRFGGQKMTEPSI